MTPYLIPWIYGWIGNFLVLFIFAFAAIHFSVFNFCVNHFSPSDESMENGIK
jgi:hypothetical protein